MSSTTITMVMSWIMPIVFVVFIIRFITILITGIAGCITILFTAVPGTAHLSHFHGTGALAGVLAGATHLTAGDILTTAGGIRTMAGDTRVTAAAGEVAIIRATHHTQFIRVVAVITHMEREDRPTLI